ncbi:hypothetical protein ACQP1W_07820 [Spirillospora sp. CA-255316]
MQLPRVVIAAVFFVIGALIAVPALASTLSDGDGTPQSATTSPTATGSASPSGTATRTGGSPSPTRTTKSPTRSPSPTPTRTRTTAPPPAQTPLRVTIGSVRCSDRSAEVTVRNTGTRTEDYAIEKNDDTEARPGRIAPGATRTSSIALREDRRTRIQVTWRNEPVESRTLTANCRGATPVPDDSPDDELPRTGSDSTVLWARAATGGAAMITGVIIFWYGGIWPRRREQMFAGKNKD